MTITGILSAILIGVVIGVLASLVVPGKQRIGVLLTIGVGILGAFLGTALARELVRLATRMGIEKMIIQVVENQVGARKMFRKLGFRQEAVLRGHVKDIHGMKRDLIVGANDVSHIWDAMESLVADFSPSVE